MQRTGLEKEDIIVLLQDGMQLEEIGKAADQLPFKEISESAAIITLNISSGLSPNCLAISSFSNSSFVLSSLFSFNGTIFRFPPFVNAKPLIIRMRNNNFKVMEEKDDGTREEIQGLELFLDFRLL